MTDDELAAIEARRNWHGSDMAALIAEVRRLRRQNRWLQRIADEVTDRDVAQAELTVAAVELNVSLQAFVLELEAAGVPAHLRDLYETARALAGLD